MKLKDIIKLLLQLRSWQKSRTLNLTALLMAVGTIDATTFEGTIGRWIVEGFLTVVHLVPFLAHVTEAQAISFLVVVGSGIFTFLRAKTDRALDEK